MSINDQLKCWQHSDVEFDIYQPQEEEKAATNQTPATTPQAASEQALSSTISRYVSSTLHYVFTNLVA